MRPLARAHTSRGFVRARACWLSAGLVAANMSAASLLPPSHPTPPARPHQLTPSSGPLAATTAPVSAWVWRGAGARRARTCWPTSTTRASGRSSATTSPSRSRGPCSEEAPARRFRPRSLPVGPPLGSPHAHPVVGIGRPAGRPGAAAAPAVAERQGLGRRWR